MWDGSGRTPADYDQIVAAKSAVELYSHSHVGVVDPLAEAQAHALISIAESLARMAPLTAEQEVVKRAAVRSIRDEITYTLGGDAA